MNNFFFVKMKNVLKQLILKYHLPKYIWFIILRIVKLEYYFEAAIGTNNALEISKRSAAIGNYELFKKYYNNDHIVVYYAFKGGNKNIIDMVFPKTLEIPGGILYDSLLGACINGNPELINKIIEKGGQIKHIFSILCRKLDYVKVKHFYEQIHEIDYYILESALIEASKKKDLMIIEFLLSKGAKYCTDVARVIVDNNNTRVADYFLIINIDSDFLKNMFYYAVMKNNNFMTGYCFENKVDYDPEKLIFIATSKNNDDIIDFCLNQGYDTAVFMKVAIMNNHMKIIEHCFKRGFKNIDFCITIAYKYNRKLVEYFEKKR